MTEIAIIADIHGNYEALESVLEDIRANFPEVKEIYCAGDIVGYGPNPRECIESIINNPHISATVKGNHDEYLTKGFINRQVNPDAAAAIDWQIGVIPLELRWELSQFPVFIARNDPSFNVEIALVHGSPQYPLDEYVFPDTEKQERLFDYMMANNIDVLILGHTHKPFMRTRFLRDLNKKLLILNPGSVGQPRDRDPRASYAVLNVENIEGTIVRVDYDIKIVAGKIKSFGMPESLGNRLFQGV
ncbi:MAG: metallophosphoesterase family protein [Candidatus Hodarchaeota archaeon]